MGDGLALLMFMILKEINGERMFMENHDVKRMKS